MASKIVTANHLDDGLVVYLSAAGDWSRAMANSRVAETKTDEAELLAAAEREVAERQIVGPCLIEVAGNGGEPRPLGWCERIRAYGLPTIALPGESTGARSRIFEE